MTGERHRSANLRKYTTGNRLYRRHVRGFHERIARQLEWDDAGVPLAPESLLDAGCGEGFLAAFLATRWPGATVMGADASAGAIKYAAARFAPASSDRLRFEVGDISSLPYPDHTFDTAVCSQVLEHLTRPEEALNELMRVCRRRVVVSVPLEPWFRVVNDLARALRISPDPGHVQFWSASSFATFLSNCTDAPVHLETYQYYQIGRVDL